MSWILFYDGDCGFCSQSIRLLARVDKRGRVGYAPLQGKLAARYGLSALAARTGGTMLLLRESDQARFTHSDALIELAKVLGGLWHIARLAALIPRPLRDRIYQFVADRRHRIAPPGAACPLPDEALRSRMRE